MSVAITDERGRPVPAPGLAAWLRRIAPARARGRVAIALVSDAYMRNLNQTYRGNDRVTDVLSFPFSVPQSPSAQVPSSSGPSPRFLGDLAIAVGQARRQARDAGHSLSLELRVLALHGVLHLIGYDHERDNGEMRRVEERLRRKGRLRLGLIERTRP